MSDEIVFKVKDLRTTEPTNNLSSGGPTGSGGKAAKNKISLGPGYSQLV